MDYKTQTQLYSAVKANDFETAKLLLRDQFDIYFKDEEGLTPLDILVQKRIIKFDALHTKAKEKSTQDSYFIEDCHALSVAKQLLEDKTRPSAVHRFAQQRINLQASKNSVRVSIQEFIDAAYEKLEENEKFMVMLLNHASANLNLTNDTRLLNFYAACTLINYAMAENFLETITDINQSIKKNSTVFPGYTALHFAAHCNVNTVKMLINKGANLFIQDVNNVTPLEICLKSFGIEGVHSALTASSVYRNILFSDGKTKLVDYIFSLRSPDLHKEFLQNMGRSIPASLPCESPIWPGFTVLHLVLTLLPEPNLQMIQDILTTNPNIVTMQNREGSTPVHQAFRQGEKKQVVVKLLLNHQKNSVNPLDKDDLSHLHIAAEINNQILVGMLLKNKANINVSYKGEPLPSVKPGWTPLHTAVHKNYEKVAKLLVESGANLLQTDCRGFTAIHLLIQPGSNKNVAEQLFASDQLKECIVKDVGLTHLHVAAWKNQPKAIERLLHMGSDIEAVIGEFEEKELVGCRSIHIAMMGRNKLQAFEVLLRRGADYFARKFDEPCPFNEILTATYNADYVSSTVDFFWSSKESQDKLQRETGITILHLVCYVHDIEKAKHLLEKGVNVNAKTHDDFVVWPGFTPLHVLVWTGLKLHGHGTCLQDDIDELCCLLLSKGADVTLSSAKMETPVLMALKSKYPSNGNKRAALLMQHQRDFSINPTNKAGMSHFHVACVLSDFETANKFLEHVSLEIVNQQVNVTDNSRFAGQTALLMALTCRAKKFYDPESQVQLTNLLLEHGANVHVVDALGYTPLHKVSACTLTRKVLMDKILIDNTDINKRTKDGKTPMEILLLGGVSSNEIRNFVSRGSQINTYNKISDVGYMGFVLNSSKYKKFRGASTILNIMLSSPDVYRVDDTGRNAIHNAVATKGTCYDFRRYEGLIQNFMDSGCNIFQQDAKGRTALHLAVKFENTEAVKALLKCGSDVNIFDSSYKTPFSYASENRKRVYVEPDSNEDNSTTCEILAKHVKLLQHVGLEVIQSNANILSEVINREQFRFQFDEDRINRLLEGCKKVKICSREFTLRDFLREMSSVDVYWTLNKSDRHAVNSFFKPICGNHYFELTGLLKLQYRKALERPSLTAPAFNGLRALLGFPLPDLCVDIVLKQLSNLDLKNMTVAANT